LQGVDLGIAKGVELSLHQFDLLQCFVVILREGGRNVALFGGGVWDASARVVLLIGIVLLVE
jgi:hypothetical protein